MAYLEWIPPAGNPTPTIVIGDDPPYQLDEDVSGLLTALGEPSHRRVAGQVGATVHGVTVNYRSITITCEIRPTDDFDLWDAREQLAAALWVPPARPGQMPSTGILRLHREDGHPPVEVTAVPYKSPRDERFRGPTCDVTIEWRTDRDARWRAITDDVVRLEQQGGLVGPLAGPLHSWAANVEQEVHNPGTAAPIVARLWGEFTTGRLVLVDTGETLEIAGHVADGDHLRIDTGFARKSITLVRADGTEERAMHRLNLDRADFFWLPPGTSTVRWEADSNVSGRAWITWRQQRAGV